MKRLELNIVRLGPGESHSLPIINGHRFSQLFQDHNDRVLKSQDLVQAGWELPSQEKDEKSTINLLAFHPSHNQIVAFGNIVLEQLDPNDMLRIITRKGSKEADSTKYLRLGKSPGKRFEVPGYGENVGRHNLNVLDEPDFKDSGWQIPPDSQNAQEGFVNLVAVDRLSGFISGYGNAVFEDQSPNEMYLLVCGLDTSQFYFTEISINDDSCGDLPFDFVDSVDLCNTAGVYAA